MTVRRVALALRLLAVLSITCGLAACERKPAVFAPPPPPVVTVAKPIVRLVEDTLEFTGRTRGFETVEVRARVKGFLEKKLVDGGRRVKQGDVLFQIDPRPFEATVAQARAELEAAQATFRIAELTLRRAMEAMQASAATQQEVDRTRADRDSAKAKVDLAQAVLTAAELDLSFTTVTAPISGRVGIVTVDVGQLVGATDPTLLATIVNDEKVYASYDMDERTLLDLRKANANRRPGEDGRPVQVVRMALANDTGFPHVGRFERADNTIDTSSGTVRIEAIFDNPDGTILAGLFVRLQPVSGERQALLVPDVAVETDQSGRYVLVVGADGIVERRSVKVGPIYDRMRRIDEGLDADARVIVNGLQRARAGSKVEAKEESAAMPPAVAPKAG